MTKQTPEIKNAHISYKGKIFSIEYFFRQGQKETIVLLHGLGGAKKTITKPANPTPLPTIH